MRKILLATTALVAFAGAAQAAGSPITVNVGGYVDFRAAQFHENTNNTTDTTTIEDAAVRLSRRDNDFESEFRLNISAEGKAANGIEYGGLISLWNGADYTDTWTGGNNRVHEDQGYVWMSGAWGKFILGDDHGASDLFVYTPTVGEGQVDGTYTDFTDPTTLKVFSPSFIDNTENSTKITYYTPKVGNENHKLQLGASYAPNLYDQGQNVIKYRNNGLGTAVTNGTSDAPYKDFVEATAQYTGNWNPVNAVITATMSTGAREGNALLFAGGTLPAEDFTSWGVGTQLHFNVPNVSGDFTLGGSYVDAGRYNTYDHQNKDQTVWTAGLKYEFKEITLGVSGLGGEGYNNGFAVAGTGPDTNHTNYVDDFKAVGFGATYTWFPGLTTAGDAVFFEQERDDTIGGVNAEKNDGHVLMLSQKITF